MYALVKNPECGYGNRYDTRVTTPNFCDLCKNSIPVPGTSVSSVRLPYLCRKCTNPTERNLGIFRRQAFQLNLQSYLPAVCVKLPAVYVNMYMYIYALQSWPHLNASPLSAGPHLCAGKISCHNVPLWCGNRTSAGPSRHIITYRITAAAVPGTQDSRCSAGCSFTARALQPCKMPYISPGKPADKPAMDATKVWATVEDG